MIRFWIILGVTLVFLFLNSGKNKNWFTPGKMFFLIIMVTFLIYTLQLSGMQNEYSITYTFMIIGLALTFYFASVLKYQDYNKLKKYNLDKSKFKICTYLLFIVVLISFFVMWRILGAPPLISNLDRSTYFVSGFGTLYLLSNALTYLVMYDIFTNKFLGKKGYIILIINLLMIILITNKTQLFYLLCQYLVLYNALRKKINIKKFIFLPVLVVIIFIIYYQFIYSSAVSSEYIYYVSDMKFPKTLMFLTEPYLYIAFNYENLFHYIANSDYIIYGKGYYTFLDILNIFNLDSASITIINQWNDFLQRKWLTTGTLFKQFFMDFGYAGMFICTFILGGICGNSYRKYCHDKKNLFNLYFYCFNIVSIFFAFFTNNFTTVNYILNLLCVWIISKICYKKKGVENNE